MLWTQRDVRPAMCGWRATAIQHPLDSHARTRHNRNRQNTIRSGCPATVQLCGAHAAGAAQSVDLEHLLHTPLPELMSAAAALRDQRHRVITFSPKVFIPLTRLCRDSCAYCTFAQPPKPGRRAYMTLDEVLAVCRLGAQQGCKEALFTLGDKPELKYPEAADELVAMGYSSTLDYVAAAAAAVMSETGLLPHINAGVMDQQDLHRLKAVSASQGLMLEGISPALTAEGGAHYGCADKDPHVRLAVIEAAGRARVPFTTGILIGIGESREERLAALQQLKQLHDRYGHIQEIIIQNFRAKSNTPMQHHPEPSLDDLLWTVAAARIIFGPDMNIQAPPNLTPTTAAGSSSSGIDDSWRALLDAGINDWGGISPITSDYVNPEKHWPHLQPLAAATAAAGKLLLPRLPVYPEYILDLSHANTGSSSSSSSRSDNSSSSSGDSTEPWLCTVGGFNSVSAAVMRASDSSGLLRGNDWVAGRRNDESDVVIPGISEDQAAATQAAAAAAAQPPHSANVQQHQQQPQPVDDRPSVHVMKQQVEQSHSMQQQQQIGQQQQQQYPAVPLPKPRAHRLWDIHIDHWGTAEGLAKPQHVKPRIQQILDHVLQTAAAAAAAAAADGSSSSARGAAALHWSQADVELLLSARGVDLQAVVAAADELRQLVCGGVVSYVVNRNINYTNVCTYGCKFCAFSKGKSSSDVRGSPYLIPLTEISRRSSEAWSRGATEVCLQGGIHPDFTGDTYLEILAAAKSGAPDIHVHAFSPLEVSHGASTLGISVREFLSQLKAAGLGSLPGTAAEVLDDQVRSVLCPDKISTSEWVDVVTAAHEVGLATTSTIMFGHVDSTAAWARHLLLLRELQAGSGGISEFVPLPFVHMEAPIHLSGGGRRGPTLRECVVMHAVARLVLYPLINNIQASWVKMGPDHAAQLLAAGCNDMGGSIMNESITKAAGASHGQELPPARMEELITAAGRTPRQRTTLYGTPPQRQVEVSFTAGELQPVYMGQGWRR